MGIKKNKINLDDILHLKCPDCHTEFNVTAGDHIGCNEEHIAYGCPNCKEYNNCCFNCYQVILEEDICAGAFSEKFCSEECYEEFAGSKYCFCQECVNEQKIKDIIE